VAVFNYMSTYCVRVAGQHGKGTIGDLFKSQSMAVNLMVEDLNFSFC